jgi:putative ABC transport system ATP-binding protein
MRLLRTPTLDLATPENALAPEVKERKVIIDLKDVKKVYQMGDLEVHALQGVNLKIYEGEFVSIMGPSGSGKSTLMNILGVLDQPTHGEYYLDGVNVERLRESQLASVRNKKIGFVFQSYNLLKRTTALRQVELPLIYAGASNRMKRAKAALTAVGLERRMDHLPTELSGGQQQRVAIARALVNEPAMILADEATGNLDSKSGSEVLQIFQRLNEEQGITVVFVTHDPWIARHSKRLIMLRDGKVVADQPVPQPLKAGEQDRPSEAAELETIFKSTYYGATKEEFN